MLIYLCQELVVVLVLVLVLVVLVLVVSSLSSSHVSFFP